jgi:hypothetical protein
LGEKLKTSSQFRDSGLVNSKIKVSDLRYPEIKQKSKHTCEKWIFFLKVKKHCYSGDKISEFYDFGRKRKTTLDLKYQKLKIARGEKQGRLQQYALKFDMVRLDTCLDGM